MTGLTGLADRMTGTIPASRIDLDSTGRADRAARAGVTGQTGLADRVTGKIELDRGAGVTGVRVVTGLPG